MTWTTPRRWQAVEMVTADLLNTHLRDNTLLLKTDVADLGFLRTGVKSFGFSSGQGNAAGGGDTQLTSFDVTIPANALANPGDALVIEGVFYDGTAGTTGARTAKLQISGGTTITILSNSTSGFVELFRLVVRRRTNVTGSLTGITWLSSTQTLRNSAISSIDWTVEQTLKFFAAHATANAIKLAELQVRYVLHLSGAVV